MRWCTPTGKTCRLGRGHPARSRRAMEHRLAGRRVVVHDGVLNESALRAAQLAVDELLVHESRPATVLEDSEERVAVVPPGTCASLVVTAWANGAARRQFCRSPELGACEVLRSTFLSHSWLERLADNTTQAIALVPLHTQWAANWGGELQVLEDDQSSSASLDTLSFLPLPGRAFLFDAGLLHARLPPTRHAQPDGRKAEYLAYQPARGVALALRLRFRCQGGVLASPATVADRGDIEEAAAVRSWSCDDFGACVVVSAQPRPRRGAWGTDEGATWSVPRREWGGDASVRSLRYGAAEAVHVVDGAWGERLHARLVARLLARLRGAQLNSEYATEQSLAPNARVHELGAAAGEAVASLLGVREWAARLGLGSQCAVRRAYVNLQGHADADEPHQDSHDAVDERGVASWTAIVYPHDAWRPEWAGGSALLAPDLHDAPWHVPPLPRRLLLFSSSVPHFARAATVAARPFAAPHQALHLRLSLVLKLACASTLSTTTDEANPAAAAAAVRGACIACVAGREGSRGIASATQWFAPV